MDHRQLLRIHDSCCNRLGELVTANARSFCHWQTNRINLNALSTYVCNKNIAFQNTNLFCRWVNERSTTGIKSNRVRTYLKSIVSVLVTKIRLVFCVYYPPFSKFLKDYVCVKPAVSSFYCAGQVLLGTKVASAVATVILDVCPA